MKIKMKRSMFIIPLALTLMIPNTTPIFADEIEDAQTQEQTDNPTQDLTTNETKEEVNHYLASFYDENGTLLETQTKESTDSSIQIHPNTLPSKEGYTFVGWTKTLGSTSIDFNKEEVCLEKTEPKMKFYAVYQENQKETIPENKTYIVHFMNENNTEIETITKESTDSSIVIHPSSTPSKENYTFIGWASEPESSKADLGKDEIRLDASNPEIFVYAVYNLNFKATVHFCDEDGKAIETKSTMQDDIHTDQVKTRRIRPSKTPSKEGYEFLGWSMTKGSETAEFNQGYVEVSLENPKVTVYAVYKEKGTKYTVHFLDNDGKEIETQTKIVDDQEENSETNGKEANQNKAVRISPSKEPSKDGYQFLGWSTNEQAKKAEFEKGYVEVKDDNRDVTVYAVYRQTNCFIVHFCDKKGKEIETVTVDNKFSLTNDPEAIQTLKDNPSMTWIDLVNDPQYKKLEGTTVKDKWIKPSKSLSNKKGYIFQGWAKDKDAQKAEYTSDQGVHVYASEPEVTVYAVYKEDEKKTCTITYYNNTEMYQNYFKEKKITPQLLSSMTYTKDVNESKLENGFNVKLSKNILKQRRYFVENLHKEFDREEFTYTIGYGHRWYARHRIDFVFSGWTTNPNGTKAEYKAGEKIKLTKDHSDIKLYAVYTPRVRHLSAEESADNVEIIIEIATGILRVLI